MTKPTDTANPTEPAAPGPGRPQDPQGPQNQQYSGHQPGFPDARYQQYPPQYMQDPQSVQAPPKQKNTVGLVGLVTAVLGLLFACIPGALIVGWVLLPIGFIVSLVSLFFRGRKQGFGLAGLIVSVVGTVVGVLVFVMVVDNAVDDAVDDLGSGGDISVAAPSGAETSGDEDAGTRANPYPLGSTVTDRDWSVTVNSVDLDAAAAVAVDNQFNEPAPEGMTYLLVNVTVSYIGESDAGESPWTTIEYVTVDGTTVHSYDSLGATTPDQLDTLSDLYKGGSTNGNILLTVPADTAGDGVLAVSPGMLSDKVFVSVR